MGNSRSSFQLRADDIRQITDETGFTKQQIERLYARFTSLDRNSHGFLTREDFLRIPELAINPLGDRIVHAFFYESKNTEEEKVDFKVSKLHSFTGSQLKMTISGFCSGCLPLSTGEEKSVKEQAKHKVGETPLCIPYV